MPFYGQDWRSPGEEWVKVSSGNWERAKINRMYLFEMLNHQTMLRRYRQDISGTITRTGRRMYSESCKGPEDVPNYMPHIIVKSSSTRENAVITSISDALIKLDMRVAIEDTRRFAYVCQILLILLRDKLHCLGGRTQLYIMDLLPSVGKHVCDTGNNIKVIRDLLLALRNNLTENKYEHVGSSQLWLKHENTLLTIEASLQNMKFDQSSIVSEEMDIPQPKRLSMIMTPQSGGGPVSSSLESQGSTSSASPQFSDLPSECIINIMSKLSTLEDLHSAAVAHPSLAHVTHGPHLWKSLISQHFSLPQLRSVMMEANGQHSNSLDDCNWPFLYKRLLRRFGEGNLYACKLHQCELCAAVFWPVYGHPCNTTEEKVIKCRVLSPNDFVRLFLI